jgi:ankyrin repeat protein
LHAREEMPPSKKKRGQAARGQPAGGGQLLDAVSEGDTAAVARLLAAGADPNALVAERMQSGEVFQSTALREAAGCGQLEVLRLLLDSGADPSLASSDGDTPLMTAARLGQLKVLRRLLGRGAAVDAVEPGTGLTAFHWACFHNKVDCAEELARVGCDAGLKDKSGHTGRELAEGKGHAAVVERLRVVVGEQLRAAQAAGPAPAPEPPEVVGDGGPAGKLVAAAAEGDGAAVAWLLAAGADPNASMAARTPSGEVAQSTALCDAAAHGRLEAARLLLEAGADASLADGDGFTPLMQAAFNGQLGVLRLLLARGAAVDAVSPGTGATAFHYACGNNQPECAEALVRAGCDVGIKDKIGQTGREVAEARGHAAVVTWLRAVVAREMAEHERELAERLPAEQAAGPDPAPEPAAVVGDGGPAGQLVMAARGGDKAVVARLLAAGTDPNASMAGRTPSGETFQSNALCAAAELGHLAEVRLLLEAGADPSLADGCGYTPLMTAAGCGQLEVLRLLLGRGATVDAVDPAYGGTAFHCACIQNQPECAEELARAGCDVGIKDKNGQTGREAAEARDSKDAARRLRALARQSFVGVLVELAGLVGAAEHNGKRATVMSERPSRGHHTSVFLPRAHILSALCASIEERYVRQSNGGGLDHPRLPRHTLPPCGARCCATSRRSSATRWSCWSRRLGAAARRSAWTCGRRTLCWCTCRPARGAPGPGGSIGFRRCSPVFVRSALTGLDSRISNGPC